MVLADADFVILGEISGEETKPEGPFGDHLGYYSLKHEFPVLKVSEVFCRDNAVYPFTVVGRPPQEDSMFGEIVHRITKPMVPASLPGVKELNAVDEAGVHPLLLAVGSERYTPYQKLRKPSELMTQAHSILGFNQCSLAKFLWIAAGDVSAQKVETFFEYCLMRADFNNDLHFITKTTMDTLDYSGSSINEGSKLVVCAAGEPKFQLSDSMILKENGVKLNKIMNGVYSFETETPFEDYKTAKNDIEDRILPKLTQLGPGVRIVVLTNSHNKYCKKFFDFIWSAFTKMDPARDIYGVDSYIENKHWGCRGALVFDARTKTHHAPELTR